MSADPSSKAPAHHTAQGFRNLYGGSGDKSLWSVFKMRWGSNWANHPQYAHLVPRVEVDLARIKNPKQACLMTWLGHSTYLIQVAGKHILTDPVFSYRASPVSFAGPKRYSEPAIPLDALPKIDFVLLG